MQQKKKKKSEILVKFKITVFYLNTFDSLLLHDPLKIFLICWFCDRESFLIIINVENGWAAKLFCGNSDNFFSAFFDKQKVQKSTDLKQK